MRILPLLPAALAAPLLLASCGLVHLPGDCTMPPVPSDPASAGCPCEPPTPGDSCDVASTGLDGPPCTYGTEQLPGCRQLFVCSQGTWELFGPSLVGGCPAMGVCPATQPADGSACANANSVCGYPNDTLCSCNQTGWSCLTSHADARCPASIPNAGTTCSLAADCTYTTGCAFRGALCPEGIWRWTPSDC